METYAELSNRINELENAMAQDFGDWYDAQAYSQDSEEHAKLCNLRDALIVRACRDTVPGAYRVEDYTGNVIATASGHVAACAIRKALNYGAVTYQGV